MKKLIIALVLATGLASLHASSVVPDEGLENIVGGAVCSECTLAATCPPDPGCTSVPNGSCIPDVSVEFCTGTQGFRQCELAVTLLPCNDTVNLCGAKMRLTCIRQRLMPCKRVTRGLGPCDTKGCGR